MITLIRDTFFRNCGLYSQTTKGSMGWVAFFNSSNSCPSSTLRSRSLAVFLCSEMAGIFASCLVRLERKNTMRSCRAPG